MPAGKIYALKQMAKAHILDNKLVAHVHREKNVSTRASAVQSLGILHRLDSGPLCCHKLYIAIRCHCNRNGPPVAGQDSILHVLHSIIFERGMLDGHTAAGLRSRGFKQCCRQHVHSRLASCRRCAVVVLLLCWRLVLQCMMECNSPWLVILVATTRDDKNIYMLLEAVMGGELFAYLQVGRG